MSEPATVYVAIGSNVDPLANVTQAVELLASRAKLTGLSRFYQTPAIALRPQQDYVNAVARVETDVPPLAFKHDVLRHIEAQLGRERGDDKDAPRTIDLDILLYSDLVVDNAELKLPAPELFQRPFLVQCLLEIDESIEVPGMPRPTGVHGVLLEELTHTMHKRWLG